MIKISFIINYQVMNFIVKEKEIWYFDKIWKNGIRCLPKNEEFIKIIRNSRNKYPAQLIEMWDISDEELKEYEENKDKGEEALAKIVIRDCANKGLQLLKKEVVNG